MTTSTSPEIYAFVHPKSGEICGGIVSNATGTWNLVSANGETVGPTLYEMSAITQEIPTSTVSSPWWTDFDSLFLASIACVAFIFLFLRVYLDAQDKKGSV